MVIIENTLAVNRNANTVYAPRNIEELISLYRSLLAEGKSVAVNSTGRNWGYGCSAPVGENPELISLKNLNRIIELDSEHGLITLQPGVTYGQLAKYLEEAGAQWIAPVHGGGPNCSVIGNVLERGYGITPNENHFQALNHLKAILKDGSIYEGALTSLGQARLDKLFRHGIGPYLDGAFTQSGLGIVTQATIKLARRPEYTEMFFYSLKDSSQLSEVVKIIKGLKRDLGNNVGGINLINRERMLSMLIDYPMDKIKSAQPLSEEELVEAARKNQVTDWCVVGAMYGEKKIVKEVRSIIKKRFKGIRKRGFFYNSSNRKFILWLTNLIPKVGSLDLKKSFSRIEEAYKVLQGVPNNVALRLAYLKHENKQLVNQADLDPTRDHCGLIWYAPLVEMSEQKVLEYCQFIKESSELFGINSFITLTTIDDVCFDSTIPILFNRNNKKDVERAHLYYEHLLNEGAKRGFFPYRLNVLSQCKYNFKTRYILPNVVDEYRYR